MRNLLSDSYRPTEAECDDDVVPGLSGSVHPVRRWASVALIVGYLGFLGHGLFCHAVQYRTNAHPAMYFSVWDMFCGWSGWSFRSHVVAEGASGAFYELTPSPWREYHPFSTLGRNHYDYHGLHAWRIGVNCLRQTEHEPMVRLFVVGETWSKKFNLPDPLWAKLHDEPRRSNRYFRVDSIYHADGDLIARHPSLLDQHRTAWLAASLQGQSGPEQVRLTVASQFTH